MFHTPAHKVAPHLPQAGTVENRPYEGDPRVIVNEPRPDVAVHNHGSVILLQPMSREGGDWVDQQLVGAMRWGGAYCVEPRYLAAIVEGMIDAGLKVA